MHGGKEREKEIRRFPEPESVKTRMENRSDTNHSQSTKGSRGIVEVVDDAMLGIKYNGVMTEKRAGEVMTSQQKKMKIEYNLVMLAMTRPLSLSPVSQKSQLSTLKK